MEKKVNSALQEELEFYTNLIAQHEKSKQRQNVNSSTSNNQFKPSVRYPKNITSCSNSRSRPNFISFNHQASKNVLTMPGNSKSKTSSVYYKNCVAISSKDNRFLNQPQLNQNIIDLKTKYPKVPNMYSKSASSSGILSAKSSLKTDSVKLMKELCTITEQLKSKSKVLGASNNSDSALVKQSIKTFNKFEKNSKLQPKPSAKKSPRFCISLKNSSSSIKYFNSASPDIKTSRFKRNSIGSQLLIAAPPKAIQTSANFKNIEIKSAKSSVLKELDTIKKVLEDATEKNSRQLFDNHSMLKTSHEAKTGITIMPKQTSTLCNVPLSSKMQHEKLASKHNLTKCKNITMIENETVKNLYSCDMNVPKVSNLINSKYKIINKIRSPPNQVSHIAFKSTRSYKCSSSNKKKNISSFKLMNNSKKYFTPPKNAQSNLGRFKKINTPQHVKRSLNKKTNHSASKYRLNKRNQEKSLNKSIPSPLDVDVDLLLELAAEKKTMLSNRCSRRTVYKSKNTIVNNYSPQARIAKMIKSKYFNPNRRAVDWRRHAVAAKNFKSPCRNYFSKVPFSKRRIMKRSPKSTKSYFNKFHTHQMGNRTKKIVNLMGEKFVVGSSGKSLKKITKRTSINGKQFEKAAQFKKYHKISSSVKSSSPLSQLIAHRALNRSISKVLSSKKKVNKVAYCMFYNRFGRCNKGVKCQYVHDPSKIAICTRFLRGTCKNDKCLFSHEINPGKMAICSFFLKDSCTKENCPYRHERLSPEAELCKAFVQGYCPQGKECKKAHILVCPKYVQGICDKGKECAFPHPAGKDKHPQAKTDNDVEKTEDHLLETVYRYFQTNAREASGSVVPKRKVLPEQPSFISLTMEEL